MRDPHVVALIYRLETDETVSFDKPPPLDWETEAFRMRLSDGVARFEMSEHYSTSAAAREKVDLFLKAWEINAALDLGRPEIRFRFDNAEIIDRDPPPPGSPQTIQVEGIGSSETFGTLTIKVTRQNYPEPLAGFAASPDVIMLFERLERYRQGREPLPSTAYAMLSFMEGRAGGRTAAARLFNVSEKVLDTLGRLTSEAYGGPDAARKYRSGTIPRPYSGAEKAWIEETLKQLIRRLGQYDHDPTAALPQLTMADLPEL